VKHLLLAGLLLAAAPAFAAGKGTIRISTTPSGARVSMDGRDVGATPWVKSLESGNTYWITVEKEGFEPVNHTVELHNGKTESFADTLQPLAGDPGRAVFAECQPIERKIWSGDPHVPPPQTEWFRLEKGAVVEFVATWGDRPSLEEFAIYLDGGRSQILSKNSNRDRLRVDDSRCFAVVEYSRQHTMQTERRLEKAEWQPGLPSGKGAFEYRRKQQRYGNDQIVLAVLVH
jgi:hypothetical protein